MADTKLIRITNTSNQVVPIMINSIGATRQNPNSQIPATQVGSIQLASGSTVALEEQRIESGQLIALQNLRRIRFE